MSPPYDYLNAPSLQPLLIIGSLCKFIEEAVDNMEFWEYRKYLFYCPAFTHTYDPPTAFMKVDGYLIDRQGTPRDQAILDELKPASLIQRWRSFPSPWMNKYYRAIQRRLDAGATVESLKPLIPEIEREAEKSSQLHLLGGLGCY